MTARARVAEMPRSRWHRFVESILPWYSVEEEQERNARSAAIRDKSIAARINAEQVRTAYEKAGARVTRR